jgi:hypothetical protein
MTGLKTCSTGFETVSGAGRPDPFASDGRAPTPLAVIVEP